MKKYLTPFLVLAFAGGANASGSKRPKADMPSHRKPASGAKVYAPGNDWNIKSINDIPKNVGKVWLANGVIYWDLEGAILDGKNQKGDGSQNENQEPMFRARVPLVVKNGFAQNVKNAMSFFAKDSGVEKMTFLSFGEDAVATAVGRKGETQAYGFRVLHSEFLNKDSGDKSVQLNEAKGARVQGNMIYNGTTCMRIGDSQTTSVSDTATVTGNKFVGCGTAIHASKITILESNNKYESVSQPWKGSNGAKKK